MGQRKLYNDRKLGLKPFKEERAKAANETDLFMVFISMQNPDIVELPHRSGIVDGEHWNEYFGPFAGRTYRFRSETAMQGFFPAEGAKKKLAENIISLSGPSGGRKRKAALGPEEERRVSPPRDSKKRSEPVPEKPPTRGGFQEREGNIWRTITLREGKRNVGRAITSQEGEVIIVQVFRPSIRRLLLHICVRFLCFRGHFLSFTLGS